MRIRHVWLAVGAAAAALIALGTLAAQQPVGSYPPSAPASTPVKPRLTSPVMASGDGVRQAGGFPLPAPSMEIPSSRSGGNSIPAPSVPIDPSEAKFPPLPPPSSTTAPATVPATPGVPAPFPAAVPSGPVNPVFGAAPPSIGGVPPAVPVVAVPASAGLGHAQGVLPARTVPSITIESVCPETVVLGQEYQYRLIVRNTGTTAVANVRVDDELPAASRYLGSDPAGELNGDRLVWLLGALEAGAEKHLMVRVKPADEGEARSRATVTFTAAVDTRTRVTRPRIAVTITGAEVCRAGEETGFQIKVTNGGSGAATRPIVRAQLSDGLLHSQGTVIEAPLETLPAGETRTVNLKVAAAKAGLQWCQIVVAAEGSADATAKAATNVVEPMLVVKENGPARCLVRAEPTYSIEIANPGTAATDPVLVQTVLPDGFEWINQASDGGSCNGRTVVWRLPSLAPGSNRTVTVKIRAVAATDPQGSLMRTVAQAGPASAAATGGAAAARSGRGLEAKAEIAVVAEGVAAVRFEVVGLENPVSVGKEVTYEIRVFNQGTGPCSNVQIAAALAEGTEFLAATTGTNQTGAVKAQGQQLTFDAIPSLGVKGEMVYRVRVKGNAAGDLRFRVQLACDQLKSPLVKEESTTFVKE